MDEKGEKCLLHSDADLREYRCRVALAWYGPVTKVMAFAAAATIL